MSQYESVAKQTAEILRNRGYDAEECVVPKINTEKIGVSVKLSNDCATVFYVEDGLTALEFADKICNQLTERAAIDVESFKALNEEDVFPVLVRADWNKLLATWQSTMSHVRILVTAGHLQKSTTHLPKKAVLMRMTFIESQ